MTVVAAGAAELTLLWGHKINLFEFLFLKVTKSSVLYSVCLWIPQVLLRYPEV